MSSRSRRRRVVGWTIMLVIAAPVCLLAYMLLLATSTPIVRRLDVHVQGWPAKAPPMRLVLISDLHVSTPSDTPERLAGIVQQVNDLRPDLVLIAGDFMSTESLTLRDYGPEAAAAPLAALHARLGTMAVLGNHDLDDVPRLKRALTGAHVRLLSDEAARAGPLAILGSEYPDPTSIRKIGLAWRRIGGLPIVMMHNPDGIPMLGPGLNLALAAHTHCGQIVLPFIGALETGSAYGSRYLCGIVREGPRLSIITGGIGTSQLPLRFGAPPDLWAIDIGR